MDQDTVSLRSDLMEVPRLKGTFHVSETSGGGDHIVGKVIKLNGSGEILGTQQGKMIMYRKHFGFLLQMIDGSHLNAIEKGLIGCKDSFLLVTSVRASKGFENVNTE